MKLSILICHLKSRAESLTALLGCLTDQILFPEDIEILVEGDNGEITTGAKRNILLDRAQGEYIAFIDDDDLVTLDYIDSVLQAIKDSPDAVGIVGKMFCLNGKDGTFNHSIRYKEWQNLSGGVYLRPPNHLNPVRREHALSVRFPDKVIGEDQDYSMCLLPLLKTEVMIEHPIYLYYTR